MSPGGIAVDMSTWDYPQWRRMLTQKAEAMGEWQGIPTPIDDMPLRLASGHPMQALYEKLPVDEEVLVGGPAYDEHPPDDATTGELLEHASHRWLEQRVVNNWYDPTHNREVYIFQRDNGRAFAMTAPRSPDQSMSRFTLAMQTIGACDAWDLDAEVAAMEKLVSHISARQRQHYLLTGMFIETSARSGLTYAFRRLRPTVVMTPHKGDTVHVLAVLCMHPIGYYDRTWAGCMVPTDDVLAHLLFMRGDEAGFWRQANQHDPASPEAGL